MTQPHWAFFRIELGDFVYACIWTCVFWLSLDDVLCGPVQCSAHFGDQSEQPKVLATLTLKPELPIQAQNPQTPKP